MNAEISERLEEAADLLEEANTAIELLEGVHDAMGELGDTSELEERSFALMETVKEWRELIEERIEGVES